ncbi:hypothetical protein A2U01_0039742 [Trifolium medium]|uniref:Uncharacterized protein n=1 Tax=Trifolium medium TaxID=97028 RepID=A0A392Q3B9_9FABA|nr:hypothetical protein [Trifolium medium]
MATFSLQLNDSIQTHPEISGMTIPYFLQKYLPNENFTFNPLSVWRHLVPTQLVCVTTFNVSHSMVSLPRISCSSHSPQVHTLSTMHKLQSFLNALHHTSPISVTPPRQTLGPITSHLTSSRSKHLGET